jgi:hypothetical protein
MKEKTNTSVAEERFGRDGTPLDVSAPLETERERREDTQGVGIRSGHRGFVHAAGRALQIALPQRSSSH